MTNTNKSTEKKRQTRTKVDPVKVSSNIVEKNLTLNNLTVKTINISNKTHITTLELDIIIANNHQIVMNSTNHLVVLLS